MVPRSVSYARLRRAASASCAATSRPRLSRPRLDQRRRLDCQNPFILIKSELQIKKSTEESDPLWRGLMSRDHGPGPWDCEPISWNFH
jgi:hypothetical protein